VSRCFCAAVLSHNQGTCLFGISLERDAGTVPAKTAPIPTDATRFSDAVRAKPRKLIAETELRLASPTEWAELLPQGRVGMRALSLDRLSFAKLEYQDCAVALNNLGRAANYVSTTRGVGRGLCDRT
jgi:hypothetical protein